MRRAGLAAEAQDDFRRAEPPRRGGPLLQDLVRRADQEPAGEVLEAKFVLAAQGGESYRPADLSGATITSGEGEV